MGMIVHSFPKGQFYLQSGIGWSSGILREKIIKQELLRHFHKLLNIW